MPKVSVTAASDFYDRANKQQRTKGSTFILRSEYADTLGKLVKVGDSVATEKVADAGPKDMTMEKIKKDTEEYTEKASAKPVAKAKISKPVTAKKKK